MKYRYRATEKFWTSFYRLNSQQKESCRKAWQIFKENAFDPRLRAHKIAPMPPLADALEEYFAARNQFTG